MADPDVVLLNVSTGSESVILPTGLVVPSDVLVTTDGVTTTGDGTYLDPVTAVGGSSVVHHDDTLTGDGSLGDPLSVVGTAPPPIELPVVTAALGNVTAVANRTNLIPGAQAGPLAITFPAASSVANGELLAVAMFGTGGVVVVDAIPAGGDTINNAPDGIPLNAETLETIFVSDGVSGWWQIAQSIAPSAIPQGVPTAAAIAQAGGIVTGNFGFTNPPGDNCKTATGIYSLTPKADTPTSFIAQVTATLAVGAAGNATIQASQVGSDIIVHTFVGGVAADAAFSVVVTYIPAL